MLDFDDPNSPIYQERQRMKKLKTAALDKLKASEKKMRALMGFCTTANSTAEQENKLLKQNTAAIQASAAGSRRCPSLCSRLFRVCSELVPGGSRLHAKYSGRDRFPGDLSSLDPLPVEKGAP